MQDELLKKFESAVREHQGAVRLDPGGLEGLGLDAFALRVEDARAALAARLDGTSGDLLERALRGKALEILSGGFDAASARRLEWFSAAAARLLQTLSRGAEALPKMPEPRQPDPENAAFGGLAGAWGGGIDDEDAAAAVAAGIGATAGLGFPLAGAPPAEAVGTRAVRELLAALPEIVAMSKQTPDAMVRAIVAAEEAGQKDLARALRRRLVGEACETPEAQHA